MAGTQAFIGGASGTGAVTYVSAVNPLPVGINGNLTGNISGNLTGNVTSTGNITATGNVTVSNPVPGNIATAQVVVGNTSTKIVDARSGRQMLTVENSGNVAVFLGATGVTVSTGLLLPGTTGASVTVSFTGAMYGVVASGNQTVTALEAYA